MTVKLRIIMKVEVPGMQLIQCKCQNCGNTLQLDLDNFQAECPSCGSKLIVDSKMLEKIMLEKVKNDKIRIKAEHDLEMERISLERRKINFEEQRLKPQKTGMDKFLEFLKEMMSYIALLIIVGGMIAFGIIFVLYS